MTPAADSDPAELAAAAAAALEAAIASRDAYLAAAEEYRRVAASDRAPVTVPRATPLSPDDDDTLF